MYYTQGDTPAAPLLVAPARDGEPVDLDGYTDVQAQLVQPDGTVTMASSAAIVEDEDEPGQSVVAVTLPKLEQAGLVDVTVQLGAGADRQDTFDVEPIVVQALDGWHTIGSARHEWDAAGKLDDGRLFKLLELAKGDCLSYARPLPDGGRPPLNYREGQLMQARNRLNASRIDPASGNLGDEGFAQGAFPLDWLVKATLRPARRFPVVR